MTVCSGGANARAIEERACQASTSGADYSGVGTIATLFAGILLAAFTVMVIEPARMTEILGRLVRWLSGLNRPSARG